MSDLQCPKCLRTFTRSFSLRRHHERKVSCSVGERVGAVMVLDPDTGIKRRRTYAEGQVERAARKHRNYEK